MSLGRYIPPLDFPYPVKGKVRRPNGQGCTSCMRQVYCTAHYWMIRFYLKELTPDYGTSCTSWSNDPADKAVPKGEGEQYMNFKMEADGIAQEANQNPE